jgi:transcriptional regulator with XRE-family HTH domain
LNVHNARELGAALRSRRQDLGWAQSDLAARVGVNRQWVVGVERGTSNPRTDLLLRALAVLGLDLSVNPSNPVTEPGPRAGADLDDLLSAYK